MAEFDRKLVLENGEEYVGFGFGAPVSGKVSELVFQTSMMGYQETVADPAYAYQTVVMAYPIIGNYGLTDDDTENRSWAAAGLVVREYNDKPSNFRYTKTLAEQMEEMAAEREQLEAERRQTAEMMKELQALKEQLAAKDGQTPEQ